jgi:hypothetical protein
MEFYRFRKISSLLGEFQELENNEIYFASPKNSMTRWKVIEIFIGRVISLRGKISLGTIFYVSNGCALAI